MTLAEIEYQLLCMRHGWEDEGRIFQFDDTFCQRLRTIARKLPYEVDLFPTQADSAQFEMEFGEHYIEAEICPYDPSIVVFEYHGYGIGHTQIVFDDNDVVDILMKFYETYHQEV